MVGEGQEDALRAPSKDLSQGGHQPVGVAMGYAGRFGAKKQTFNNRFHYSEEQKNMSKDDKGCSIVCQRCGRCCEKLSETGATINDIATWITTRRFDILKWVDPIFGPSSDVVAFDIWIGPRTHDHVKKCPWLRKVKGSSLYECAIYDVRPAACRDWPIDLAEGQELGCPACEEKSPGKAGTGAKVVKPRRDED